MEIISKLEKTIEQWLKPMPHLPESARKWIAINIWWLELIGVILLAFASLMSIGTLLVALGISSSLFGLKLFNAMATVSGLVFLLFTGASVAVMSMAISPLKALKKKGWDLLFIALLINAASIVCSAFLSMNFGVFITNIFSGAIGIAVGAYFLFEIRSHFVSIKK